MGGGQQGALPLTCLSTSQVTERNHVTILVTGATGNIGRCVVERLVGAGQRVRAMTRDPRAARLPAGVEVVYGDFERPETWRDALEEIERVYLFPFAYVIPESDAGFVGEAVKAGVRRFVVHSAAAAEFPPGDDQYDQSISSLRRHLAMERDAHREQELLVEATDVEWTHVRPGLLAAGALGWAEQIRAGYPVVEPYGAAGSALVHEADVAEIAVAALLTDAHIGAAYTITGPAKVSQAEQVAAIAAATGQDIRFEEVSPEAALEHWHRQGYPHDIAAWLIESLAATVDGPGLVPATDTFERITGRPARTFAQWAVDHAEEFRVVGDTRAT
ncbi:NAD(P)H-binding protein [Allokutzneria sp. A3M-2-11 16]|uniref:NAD(P)H-binding protein n=1 Tax=Allokutzneria sp. A3M-2-11 16 TaxID=2962043 RepID=UPI0020B6B91A|nr:NAD(P)H-binding protein [Allokutzneria sp. A3M-2-11 16]MCP3802012.1 NAD(P)H-binding protein [Allokutzneria sp. A3M-2-11 16]